MQVGESTNVRRVQRPGGPIKHLTRSAQHAEARPRRGLKIDRRHTTAGQDVWETTTWTLRSANIGDGGGSTVFEQADLEIPSTWSQLATNVVASKYFRGHLGTPERERSVKQLIGRVANTIADWGKADGYFASDADAETFRDELTYLLLHQMLAFNSPVWFNVGVEPHPQCSACFINAVDDTMESILELAKTEARLFKGGSGTGSNLSPLRSSKEKLAGGGTASGPVSFMRGFDAFAGVIKSGGKTRRAAKMVILNADHPDIMEFVGCKAHEEQKAWALIEQGYDGTLNGEAYGSVFFQNANHSIRVSDEFMRAAVEDRPWQTRAVTTGEPMETLRAKEVLGETAKAAHLCGDPGIQFDTTINLWHTCKNTAPINASNPCSEYMFLDDSACNLASINLMRFLRDDSSFDADGYRHTVELSILAQEIIVDNSSYPTARIADNSHDYRPLGLGYANLGALLMALGLPYDSDAGRAYTAALTSVMCGHAYATSAMIAESRGPFAGYSKNAEPFLGVMRMHRDHAYAISDKHVPAELLLAARECWDEAIAIGGDYGFRNAQVTVIAPTGTIAFMMDCDTTGIEPDIALVKYKRLVGGGMLKIVNRTVPLALKALGYDGKTSEDIVAFIEQHETIEGAPGLKDEHLPVFDCAFRAKQGARSISPMGHVRMMAAAQPFLSGAISKTVNMPEDASVADIFDIYTQAWRLGLKAIAIYRDGCKKAQPLSTSKDDKKEKKEAPPAAEARPARRSLPVERAALTHKFAVAGHEGYITVGLYEDGTPGELFITMSKEGSTISGLMDTIATSISLALQYGVPLRVLVDRFSHMRFEPSGFTGNKDIPMAKSIVDYIFRWLGQKFLREEDGHIDSTLTAKAEAVLKKLASPQISLPISAAEGPVKPIATPVKAGMPGGIDEKEIFRSQADAPPCHVCGTITVRAGACYACPNCGATSGCS
ncbi:MAG: vitamin B12-dependent ribonucleotide reductase [Deltaproteobacteria bacterium]|nr:vitamin B12-dependent ribonucleotide reductase [Deltaproteobacteria bacterium]